MDKNIQIDQNLIDYIFSHTEHLHPIQKKLLKYNDNLGHLKRLQISILQANFIQFLIKINNYFICQMPFKNLKIIIFFLLKKEIIFQLY